MQSPNLPVVNAILFHLHIGGESPPIAGLMNVSNETLEVLVTADQADGARGWELHAGLSQGVTGREVVLRVHLDGEDALTSLDTSSRADVLAEGAAHALRDTVCTGSGGLLVFSKDVVREGVDAKSVALGTGLLTDGGVRDDTSCFQSRVSNLDIVIGSQFNADGELTGLSRPAVADVILMDTVVGHTTDVLTAGVGRSLQASVHHSWFSCHRSPSKHTCDPCSLYDISASVVRA